MVTGAPVGFTADVNSELLPSSEQCAQHSQAFDQLFSQQGRIIALNDEEIVQPLGAAGINPYILVRHLYVNDAGLSLVRAAIFSANSNGAEDAFCLVEENGQFSFWVHKLRVLEKHTGTPRFVEWPRRAGTDLQLKSLASKLGLQV